LKIGMPRDFMTDRVSLNTASDFTSDQPRSLTVAFLPVAANVALVLKQRATINCLNLKL